MLSLFTLFKAHGLGYHQVLSTHKLRAVTRTETVRQTPLGDRKPVIRETMVDELIEEVQAANGPKYNVRPRNLAPLRVQVI